MAISEAMDEQMARKMFVIYGKRFPAELADELIGGLRFKAPNTTDAEYERAVEAWCASSSWPPSPKDIIDLVQSHGHQEKAQKQEQFEKEQEARLVETIESESTRTVEIMGRTVTYTVEHRPVRCHECSDTGKAHFYHIDKAAWLNSQWDEMTDEQKAVAKHETALCDCPAGMAHPHRAWTMPIWLNGQQRVVNCYPILEGGRNRLAVRSDDPKVAVISAGRRFDY